MSTFININVDLQGILNRLKEQQGAQRQAQLEKEKSQTFEEQIAEATRQSEQQQLRSFAKTPAGKQVSKPLRRDELAAFRRGCPTTIELSSSAEYAEYQWATVSFTGTVNTDASEGVLIRGGLLRHSWSQVNFLSNPPDPEDPAIYEWQEEDTLRELLHLSLVSAFDQFGARFPANARFNMFYPVGADDTLFNSGDYIAANFNFGYVFYPNRSLVQFRGYQRWYNYIPVDERDQYGGAAYYLEPFPRPLAPLIWGTLSDTDKIGPYEVGVELSSDGGNSWIRLVWASATSTGAGTAVEYRAVTDYTPFVIDMRPANESAPSVAANCVYKR